MKKFLHSMVNPHDTGVAEEKDLRTLTEAELKAVAGGQFTTESVSYASLLSQPLPTGSQK